MKRYVACWFYIIIYKAGKNIFSLEYISKSTSRIERLRHFFSPFGLFKLNQQHEDVHQQRVIPVSLRCPPVPPKYFRVGFLCVPCGFVSPRLLAGARFLLKTASACTYVCERKQCARGHSFLTAKYSYAYAHTPSLSENRNRGSQNNKIFLRWNVWTSREQFRVFVHPQKKLRPHFRESVFYGVQNRVASNQNRWLWATEDFFFSFLWGSKSPIWTISIIIFISRLLVFAQTARAQGSFLVGVHVCAVLRNSFFVKPHKRTLIMHEFGCSQLKG